MTELACHQLQIGSWALRKIPEKVMGHGAITYWKDGRDVYDNVSCVYVFDDGVKMTFDSVISNKFLTYNKCICQTERCRIYCIRNIQTKLFSCSK